MNSVVGLKMIIMTWKTTGMDSVILDSAPNGVARPCESTSMHGWRLHGERVTGLASDGITGIVSPG